MPIRGSVAVWFVQSVKAMQQEDVICSLLFLGIGSQRLATLADHHVGVASVVLQTLFRSASWHFLLRFLFVHFWSLVLYFANLGQATMKFSHGIVALIIQLKKFFEKVEFVRNSAA